MKTFITMQSYVCIAGFRPIIILSRSPPFTYGRIGFTITAKSEPTVGNLHSTTMWNSNDGLQMSGNGLCCHSTLIALLGRPTRILDRAGSGIGVRPVDHFFDRLLGLVVRELHLVGS